MTALALVEAATGRTIEPAALDAAVTEFATTRFDGPRGVVAIAARLDIDSVIAYEAARRAGHVVFPVDSALPQHWPTLVGRYRPAWWLAPSPATAPDGYRADSPVGNLACYRREGEPEAALHPDLALLLSTSGSTGSPKAVRLSHKNIASNTAAIVEALGITDRERVALHLPLSYSFGLSVLHTHRSVGSTVVLVDHPLTSGAFWSALREHQVTTLPVVPTQATMLQRLGLDRLAVPSLHTLLQAGGRTAPEVLRALGEALDRRNGRLFVMYGQTEAAPRITVCPAERWRDKLGSVGIPVAETRLSIVDGEVVVEGPGVMMGYAESSDDLALGDACGGRLPTGDLGVLDADGYLTLTGRASRIAKVQGYRIALDEVEQLAGDAIAVQVGDGLRVCTTGDAAEALTRLRAALPIHHGLLDVRHLDTLPTLPNGKLDRESVRNLP